MIPFLALSLPLLLLIHATHQVCGAKDNAGEQYSSWSRTKAGDATESALKFSLQRTGSGWLILHNWHCCCLPSTSSSSAFSAKNGDGAAHSIARWDIRNIGALDATAALYQCITNITQLCKNSGPPPLPPRSSPPIPTSVHLTTKSRLLGLSRAVCE